jgi:hypothetical protein
LCFCTEDLILFAERRSNESCLAIRIIHNTIKYSVATEQISPHSDALSIPIMQYFL